jgi:hypothetical protein
MAAVSSASPVHDLASVSAVREFLQRAIALYRDVLALHHDGDRSITEDGPSAPDELLSAHATQLRDSIQALKFVLPAAVGHDMPHPLTTVPGACYKVGQDLLLHLCKVSSQDHEAQPKPTIDAITFRDIWPIRDVAMLGTRLQELSQRFHDDIDPTFE